MPSLGFKYDFIKQRYKYIVHFCTNIVIGNLLFAEIETNM
jgi:hypothetical protein